MPHFNHCEFSPLELRKVLRLRLLPGERVVGWAPAWVNPPASLMILAGGMVLVPIVGHALLSAMLASHRRLVVLTDARLLVLAASRTACDVRGRGVKADVPLHSVSVAATRSPLRFRVRLPDRPRADALTLECRTRPSKRLREGLALLSGDGVPETEFPR